MESLSAYGSDDEVQTKTTSNVGSKRDKSKGQHSRKDDDTNYDHVTMDMSEESNNNNSDYDSPRRDSHRRSSHSSMERDYNRGGSSSEERISSKSKENRQSCDEASKSSSGKNSDKSIENVSYPTTSRSFEEKHSFKDSDANGDKRSDKDLSDRRNKDDRRERDSDKKDRDFDREKRHDSDRDRHSHSNDRYDKRHSGDDRRSHSDRKRERSRSRDKSHSHRKSSPNERDKYRHGYRYSESSKRRSGSRERRGYRRSRSKSPSTSEYKPSYKVSKKLQAMDKMGLQIKTPDGSMATAQMLLQQTFAEQVEKVKSATGIELPKYYNPAAMNPLKYATQIQKRKLLWGNKSKEASGSEQGQNNGAPSQSKAPVAVASGSNINKWQGTKFAQDSDGKVASKFMRLMGIKNPVVTQNQGGESTGDIVKKQEEMFEAMQAQYEVARATTHTMRGVGLGFSSHKPF